MNWVVQFPKRVAKAIGNLPIEVQTHLESLVDDIETSGPVRGDWPNYSKLSDGSHHCHLSYSYVAIWQVLDKKVKIVEVIYVGSRKDAPY